MGQISLLICAVALILGGGPAIADGPPGHGQPTVREQLARTVFPIPEQPTFEADLAVLADVVAAKIEHPAPANPLRDRVFGHELTDVLELAQKWPAEEFRKPIVTFLTQNSDFRKLPDSRPGLLIAIGNVRSDLGGEPESFGLEKISWQMRKTIRASESRFTPVEGLLPAWRDEIFRELRWPRGMTVATAASQLRDDELSVRLQSWVWLAEQGIIAPAEAVLECWSRLTATQKRLITELRPMFLGQRRLLMLFEQLLFTELTAGSSPYMQRRLRLRQVQLGSDLPTAEARRIVKAARQRADFPDGMTTAERDALEIVCESPGISDVAMLIEARKAKSEWVVLNALNGLCRIDHPDAIQEVGEFLATPKGNYSYSRVLHLIQRQSAHEVRNREQYLAVLAPPLRACVKRVSDGERLGRPPIRELVEAFALMCGVDFREAALLEQKKMIRSVARGYAWSSSRGFSTHVHENYVDLPTATATVYLRWYDEKLKNDGER